MCRFMDTRALYSMTSVVVLFACLFSKVEYLDNGRRRCSIKEVILLL